MKSLKHNDWNSPLSQFKVNRSKEGILLGVSGVLEHNEIEFDYAIHRQKEGSRSLMRGKIKLISPETGGVLMVNGKQAVKEVAVSNDDTAELKKKILSAAESLYASHAKAIDLALGRGEGNIPMRPDAVTPVRACREYSRRFIKSEFPKSSPKKNAERLNTLQRIYYGLADVPMSKYSARQVEIFLKDNRVGKEATRLAERFWQYCLDKGYCRGVNPFPAHTKHRKSESALQRQAVTAATISREVQANLFRDLYANTSALDCGVALLSSGFTAEQICDLRWQDVWLDTYRPDYVRVHIYLPERAGAQHNYTRPCTPQCALILRKRRETLQAQSNGRDIRNNYILGKKKRTATPGVLSKYASTKLVKAGIANDTVSAAKKEAPTESAARVLLRNTYRQNLVLRCGLDEKIDGGTFHFLCGLSLAGDTTSSNYTSFTSEEAQERLYYLLRILQPETDIPSIPPEENEDGSVIYHITPRTTAEHAGVVIQFLLQPGEEFCSDCLHGLTGNIHAEEWVS